MHIDRHSHWRPHLASPLHLGLHRRAAPRQANAGCRLVGPERERRLGGRSRSLERIRQFPILVPVLRAGLHHAAQQLTKHNKRTGGGGASKRKRRATRERSVCGQKSVTAPGAIINPSPSAAPNLLFPHMGRRAARPTIVQRARLLAHEGLSSYHSSRRLIALEPLRSPSSWRTWWFPTNVHFEQHNSADVELQSVWIASTYNMQVKA